MKNQDESTTFLQLSYRTFTIFKTFFYLVMSLLERVVGVERSKRIKGGFGVEAVLKKKFERRV